MALDGIFLHAINLELQKWIGSYVDSVFQTAKFEFVFNLRYFKCRTKIFISVNSSISRINLTNKNFKIFDYSTEFFIILREHLVGARFFKVKQQGLDRLLFLEFERNEGIGHFEIFVLAVELFGKDSNMVLFDKSGRKIISALKQFSGEVLLGRRVEPGQIYSIFNVQNKMNILDCNLSELVKRIFLFGALKLSKALVLTLEGISPVVARDIAFNFDEKLLCNFNGVEKSEVFKILERFKNRIETNNFEFCVFLDKNIPKEFCWFELKQFGTLLKTKKFESASELLDFFYYEKVLVERFNQQCYNVAKRINSEIEKVRANKALKLREIDKVDSFEIYKNYADLLSVNLHKIKKGSSSVVVENFYGSGEPVEIKLDSTKSPSQNVKFYYEKFRKLKFERQSLQKLISSYDDGILFLEKELKLLFNAKNNSDILRVVSDLAARGFYSDRFFKKKLHEFNEN